MIAVCAAATALTTAGILVGGGWGKFLIIVGLVGNHAWLIITFVRWWRRASDQARRIVFAATVAYAAGWFIVRVAAGPIAAWVLGLAGIGYVAVVTSVFWTTGYLAVHHANREQAAITAIEASRNRRELTR